MISTICLYTKDQEYNKKFCNVANKLNCNKKIYINFNNTDTLNDYIKAKKNIVIIVDEKEINVLDELSKDYNFKFFILTENKNNDKKENYIYKLQQIKNIIEYINNYENTTHDDDINYEKKIVLYINVENNKTNDNNIKRMLKSFSKKMNTLYINLNDFENYKNSIGLSNIIYNYKENKLNIDNIMNQIEDKTNNSINTDILHSVTYPEDYSVISNIELYKIFEYIVKLKYDLFFVNVEFNYFKLQYLLNISNKIICFDNSNINFNNFKNYLKIEYIDIYNKLVIIDLNENNKIDAKLINNLIIDK